MAFETFKGTFAAKTGTGSQTVSFSPPTSFTPKAIIMWSDVQTAAGVSAHLQFCKGFSDGTTDFCVGETSEDNVGDSNCGEMNSSKVISLYSVAPALLSECDLTSFGADQFIVDWTTSDSTAYLIHYFVLGGDDLTSVDCTFVTVNTSSGNQSFTGVGFEPDCQLYLGNRINLNPPNTLAGNADIALGAALSSAPGKQVSVAGYSEDASAAANTAKILSNATCIQFLGDKSGNPGDHGKAAFVSFDADGMTLNWTTAPTSAFRLGVLSLKGGKYFMASERSPNLAAGSTQVITGVDFEPKGAMFWSVQAAATGLNDHQGPLIGAASAAGVEGCLAALDYDTPGTMEANTRSLTDKVMSFEDVPQEALAVDEECDLTSFDADGMTLEWTTLADALNRFSFLCFGDAGAMPASGDIRKMLVY